MDSAAIGGQIIARSLEDFEGDLEGRVRLAMERAWTDDTWYTASGNEKLRAALYAVIVSLEEGSDDRRRVERSVEMMRDLNALLSGVPVDPEAVLVKYADMDVLPLMKWWVEYVERDKQRWASLKDTTVSPTVSPDPPDDTPTDRK